MVMHSHDFALPTWDVEDPFPRAEEGEDVAQGGRRDLWRLLEALPSRVPLPIKVIQALIAHTSLEACQALLFKEALSRLWASVQAHDQGGVRQVATITETIGRLDREHIRCVSPQTILLPQMDAGQGGYALRVDSHPLPTRRENEAWGCVLRLRLTCQLNEALVRARLLEEQRPVPESLSQWHAWLIAEAINNLLLAAFFHDNPPSGGGSAWLVQMGTRELAGVARLLGLGVRPAETIPLFPAWPLGVGSVQSEGEGAQP